MPTEQSISAKIKKIIAASNSGPIDFRPYTQGTPDAYGQREPSFGTAVPLIGRAILKPTMEEISSIGKDMAYDIAFLFSREELVARISANEGRWVNVEDRMEWKGAAYKIVKVHPTGQISDKFLMVIVLASTVVGQRSLSGVI